MIKTKIKICDPGGFYPKQSFFLKDIGYFVYKNIPLLFEVDIELLEKGSYSDYLLKKTLREELFYVSFLFDKIYFNFTPGGFKSMGFIVIKSKRRLNQKEIISKAKKIIDGIIKIPIVYNVDISEILRKSEDADKILGKIKKAPKRDLSKVSKESFENHAKLLAKEYTFSKYKINIKNVEKYHDLFLKSSRYVHIALHYFLRANSLSHSNFIEEAGINLNLCLEAIIKDFMVFQSIKDKKKAIDELVKFIKLKPDEEDFLLELKEYRDWFLAHLDEDMFTKQENINDPDEYCYEHSDLIRDVILRYIIHKPL